MLGNRGWCALSQAGQPALPHHGNADRCGYLWCDDQSGARPLRSTNMRINPLLAVVVIMATVPNAFADIYKCKDAKGKVTYSSTPCPARAASLPVDKIINYENSPQGKESAAVLKIQGDALRQKNANDLRLWEEIKTPKKALIPKNRPSQNKDPGPCLGDCGSEQGMCVAQCNNNSMCVGNCSAAWGRCQSRCH